jgi:hypothetical protein
VEFAKFRALDLEDSIYNQVIGATAVEVFGLAATGEKLVGGTTTVLNEATTTR